MMLGDRPQRALDSGPPPREILLPAGEARKFASRPIVVQHCAGLAGAGGPATAMERLLASPIAARYEFVVMRQEKGAGGVDTGLVRRWVRQLRAVRPDVVHIRGLGNEGFHGVLAARLANCPRILLSIHGTVRDISAPRSLRRAAVVNVAERSSLRMATHIATVCEWGTSRSFLSGVRNKMVGTVPNGVNLPHFNHAERQRVRSDLGIGTTDLALMTVGRLTAQKGHFIFAEALRLLRHGVGDIVVVVIGSGPESGEIALAYSQVLGSRIRMLGNRSDVDSLLRAGDIFVFPTLHENLSNALLEAMAAGVPAIASAVGGNIEVLGRGGGALVPAGSARALASAIDQMAGDPDGRAADGAIGRRVVAEQYSLDRMVQGWDAVYQRVLLGRT